MMKTKRLTNRASILRFLIGCSAIFPLPLQLSAQDFLEDFRVKMKANGWPTSLEELNKWYVTPPEGENGADLVLSAINSIDTTEFDNLDVIRLGFPGLHERLTESDISSAERFFEKNKTAFEALTDSINLDQHRYPEDFSNGTESRTPYLSPIVKTIKMLRLMAVCSIIKGDFDRANLAVRDMILLSETLKQGPTMIVQIASVTYLAVFVSTLEWMFNDSEIPETALAELQKTFSSINEESLMTRRFIGELTTTLNLLTLPEDELVEVLFLWEEDASRIARLLQSPQGHEIISQYFDFQSQLIASSQKTYPQSMYGYQELSKKIEELEENPNVLVDFFGSTSWKAFARQGRTVASLRLAKTAIAIEQYRLNHEQKIPDSLELLVPNYLSEIYSDPFDGEPLRFKKLNESSYKIYSIGDDFRDDGGTNRQVSDDGYDIIFEVER